MLRTALLEVCNLSLESCHLSLCRRCLALGRGTYPDGLALRLFNDLEGALFGVGEIGRLRAGCREHAIGFVPEAVRLEADHLGFVARRLDHLGGERRSRD